MTLKLLALSLAAFIAMSTPAAAQERPPERANPVIQQVPPAGADDAIARRITNIFGELDALAGVEATVSNGVVELSGAAPNDAAARRALDIASRIEGVVTVEDNLERTLTVSENVTPLIDSLLAALSAVGRAWPLYLIALSAFLLIFLAAHFIASFKPLWRMLAPNDFIARFLGQIVRAAGFIAGLLVALSVLDAMALFGAVAGAAGVIGLGLGFAIRDTIENYISSIMLSLRQPFRADDHVVINDLEGVVVRLTSRATILMTLDGNHLRIPNSQVFKGVVLNYTRNPERRFSFELGVDANDDPIEACNAGLEALNPLGFILDEPAASAVIREVGDSNIVIQYFAWIDQRETDFQKARSAAISAAKNVLEERGFTLPEPIYRVRLDDASAKTPGEAAHASAPAPTPSKPAPASAETIDVSPDNELRRQVAEDRAAGGETDLLNEERPIE